MIMNGFCRSGRSVDALREPRLESGQQLLQLTERFRDAGLARRGTAHLFSSFPANHTVGILARGYGFNVDFQGSTSSFNFTS